MLARWLRSPREDVTTALWLVGRALPDCHRDPAYVQSLRLMAKERQYHRDLRRRLADQICPSPGHGRPASASRGSALRRRLLGCRFEMSLLLLRDCAELILLDRLVERDADPTVTAVCRNLAKDKRAHIGFVAERLTALYADFNFIRRNLRRLRLRVMCAAVLTRDACRHWPLARRFGFPATALLTEGARRFAYLLERITPYRRDALLAALLSQRSEPYAKTARLP
ncbi:MAG: hypothetical protein CMJ18_17890 [Phycisphaeraceae bacterium]|nr:hypothetical protein [Phycisphaeraceae bacterium]